MIRPLAHDGSYFAVSHESDEADADASKNEVSIESMVARPVADRDADHVAVTRIFGADCVHPFASVVTDNKDDAGGY